MSQTCNKCGNETAMSNEPMAMMPMAQHEKDQERLMEIIKSLIAVILVLVFLLVGSNIAWVIYENSFEDYVITQDVEQDADNGTNNFIGGDVYGETEGQNND